MGTGRSNNKSVITIAGMNDKHAGVGADPQTAHESPAPTFTLRADDDIALIFLRDYALACAMAGFEEKGRPAVEALEAFYAWRHEHGLDLEVGDAVA